MTAQWAAWARHHLPYNIQVLGSGAVQLAEDSTVVTGMDPRAGPWVEPLLCLLLARGP